MKETKVIEVVHDLLYRLRKSNQELEEQLKEALDDSSRVVVSFADDWSGLGWPT